MYWLSPIDWTVIIVYLLILVGFGFYLRKRASASLEDYFLGGRRLPWWALGISGMASFLDITGTMVIVSFLFMLGPRGLYIEFRGGAVLVLVFALLWVGKWHRRSGCITGAEWNIFRFGTGPGAQFSRILAAVAGTIGTIGMLAYMVKGVGLFLSMFIPFSPFACSLVMIGIATLYTMASGFYGVVFTDIFQSGFILIAVVGTSIMAILAISDYNGELASLAAQITGNPHWLSSTPRWVTPMPEGYESYQHLGMFMLFYLLRNVMGGIGGGADPKYFGARDDRSCGLLTFLWTWLMMVRWPMMMGFAVLGIFLIHDLFPDQSVLAESAALIKQVYPDIEQAHWADLMAAIMHNPQSHPDELIAGLQNLLGDDWSIKLYLLSFHGTPNAERILPAVLFYNIPVGLRGLIMVALIAASMSTFDSTVNSTTGLFTRDIYQAFIRPHAARHELMLASYGYGVAIVACGFLFGYFARNINDIWGWITMGLGAGLAVPGILRLYWWRFNAGGMIAGTMAGLVTAITARLLQELGYVASVSEIALFIVVTLIPLIACIIGTYLTKPTDPDLLRNFYIKTRPFGIWGHLKHTLPREQRDAMTREHRYDLLAVPFTLGWQVTLFLLPMQLIIRTYQAFAVTLVIFLICLAGVYLFWYRNLPASGPMPDADQT